MLRLNKNCPSKGPVCYPCFVGKEFGFGVRWKLIIFGKETGKSMKTALFQKFLLPTRKVLPHQPLFWRSRCLVLVPRPHPSVPFSLYFPFPFASFLLPGGSAFPLSSPASMDALPPQNLQELLLILLFPAGQKQRADEGGICFPSPLPGRA